MAALEENGPAAQAGLLAGDVVVALDGDPVTGVDDLHRRLTEELAGHAVVLNVLRRAAMRDVTVVAAEG